ncbi:MAG: hypothetical protein IBX70_08385 [Clostridia bacterium]|nr:hypothetical protein [Clostridia bacterium]
MAVFDDFDAPPVIIESRTLVPARFLAESMKSKVFEEYSNAKSFFCNIFNLRICLYIFGQFSADKKTRL